MPFGLVYRYHRFGGAYCLHFQNSALPSLHYVRRKMKEHCTSHQHRHKNLNPEYTCCYILRFKRVTTIFDKFLWTWSRLSVRLSARMKQLTSHSADFREIRHWEFLLTYVGRIQVWLKLDFSSRRFTQRPTKKHKGTSPYTSACNTVDNFNSIWRHEDAICMDVNRAKTYRHNMYLIPYWLSASWL
jgi:hypothetical protein